MAESILIETPPDAAERVAALPRRVAHAVHALLACQRDDPAPARAREIVVYDREALNQRGTSDALRRAARLGLAARFRDVWIATDYARSLEEALEDRFLAETQGEESANGC